VSVDSSHRRQSRAEVLLADAQPVYRDRVRDAIRCRPRLSLVGEAGDGPTALNLIEQRKPATAVLDVDLPELDGIEVLRAVVKERMPTRVLFLSSDNAQLTVYRALTTGAAGFLSKYEDTEEICMAIELVARGGSIISPHVQHQLIRELWLRGAGSLLGDREREILRLLAGDKTAREIGAELHLSEKTVKSILSRTIYRRLGVHSAAAAVAEALKHGWIQ
jgi:two-component system, NarL family, nitrate/nitrite response regulator NarL